MMHTRGRKPGEASENYLPSRGKGQFSLRRKCQQTQRLDHLCGWLLHSQSVQHTQAQTWQNRRVYPFPPVAKDMEGLLTACSEVIEAELKSQQERNEVLAVTGLLASLRDIQKVGEFFRRRSLMNLLQQTPLFQELTRDLAREAEQRGELRSRQQFVLQLLQHKFGPLPEQLATALQAITDLEMLDRLGRAVIDSPDLAAFEQQMPPAQS